MPQQLQTVILPTHQSSKFSDLAPPVSSLLQGEPISSTRQYAILLQIIRIHPTEHKGSPLTIQNPRLNRSELAQKMF